MPRKKQLSNELNGPEMTLPEIAEALGKSKVTIEEDYRLTTAIRL